MSIELTFTGYVIAQVELLQSLISLINDYTADFWNSDFLYKLTIQLTFEILISCINWQYSWLMRIFFFGANSKPASKLRSLVISYRKLSSKLTFENFYLRDLVTCLCSTNVEQLQKFSKVKYSGFNKSQNFTVYHHHGADFCIFLSFLVYRRILRSLINIHFLRIY